MALTRVDVSVLLPIVGVEWKTRDIERAIASVKAQQVTDWRLSVVDATYNDEAKAIARRMVPKDRLIWETPVLLSEATLASCLWQAAGGMKSLWAAYIDPGVEWSSDHLLRLLSVGRSYDLDVVFSGAAVPQAEFWGKIPEHLKGGNFIDPTSVLHTQGAYRQCIAGWRREMKAGADWDLWLQMGESGAKFGHVGIGTVERRRSTWPRMTDDESQQLRSRHCAKSDDAFTAEELEFLAAEEDESAEESLYMTKGSR